jgi:hypothetical protein
MPHIALRPYHKARQDVLWQEPIGMGNGLRDSRTMKGAGH